MPEQLQKILDQVTEWWKKFSTKQKVLLLSIVATMMLALAILAFVVSRPPMLPLIQCETAAEAGKVKELLDSDKTISYEVSQNGLDFTVDQKSMATASILLGSNDIPSEGFGIDDVFEGGFSSTEADKTKRYKRYLEERFASQLEIFSNVESASVMLTLAPDDGTILAQNEESHAAVILTLADAMDDDQALGIAKYIATQLGNKTTDNITILDSASSVLFSGGDSASNIGMASSQLSLRAKMESLVKSRVKDVLVGSGLYDQVEVAPNLDLDFDQTNRMSEEYSTPEGQTNGPIKQESNFEQETQGGLAAVPGTDANDDIPTQVIDDNNYSSSSTTDSTRVYENNKTVTETIGGVGNIRYDSSSISLTAKNYVIYNEDTLRASGALEGITFEEYIAQNSEPVMIEVDQEYYTMVANATGFPAANISIIAFNEPVYQYSTNERTLSDYLQIILAVLILLLLGYVVFRSTRKEKPVEMEPELSVETLLESTKDNMEEEDSLADIGYNEKSETRLLIEKFVEENPEAAASLLRNWLNEEWE